MNRITVGARSDLAPIRRAKLFHADGTLISASFVCFSAGKKKVLYHSLVDDVEINIPAMGIFNDRLEFHCLALCSLMGVAFWKAECRDAWEMSAIFTTEERLKRWTPGSCEIQAFQVLSTSFIELQLAILTPGTPAVPMVPRIVRNPQSSATIVSPNRSATF